MRDINLEAKHWNLGLSLIYFSKLCQMNLNGLFTVFHNLNWIICLQNKSVFKKMNFCLSV